VYACTTRFPSCPARVEAIYKPLGFIPIRLLIPSLILVVADINRCLSLAIHVGSDIFSQLVGVFVTSFKLTRETLLDNLFCCDQGALLIFFAFKLFGTPIARDGTLAEVRSCMHAPSITRTRRRKKG
jgi:hypothetical protein